MEDIIISNCKNLDSEASIATASSTYELGWSQQAAVLRIGY